MLSEKQKGLLSHRTRDYLPEGIELLEFEKWARENLDTFTMNNLLEDIKNYEENWEEKYLDSFKGQIKHLYEGN